MVTLSCDSNEKGLIIKMSKFLQILKSLLQQLPSLVKHIHLIYKSSCLKKTKHQTHWLNSNACIFRDTLYRSYWVKVQPKVIWGHKGQIVFLTIYLILKYVQ